ncbi:hypothetical protein HORIV_35570 [Vreelandella olivaria]|uniref:Uncharacterized protein n=1 Tax=Vreelandella olivaria TaxID=390919 RepID=A0ABN5X2X3_9GAMM|nr:hypothetical protein HORIV_35570 [Halomonas olivaria]
MPRITPQAAGGNNVCAFLDVLAFVEIGKPMLQYPRTDDGYRVIVGSIPSKLILLDDYADHPRRSVKVRKGLYSTAASRYQQLSRFWPHYRNQLGLPDSGPLSQDRCAIQPIREQRLDPYSSGRDCRGYSSVPEYLGVIARRRLWPT